MQSANEILKFNYSTSFLNQDAESLFPIHFTRTWESRIKNLNELSAQVGKRAYKFSGLALIPQVFRKFKAEINKDKIPTFGKIELRTLPYCISYSENNFPTIFSNPKELEIVFNMLQSNWRESYIVGLIDCLLKNWGNGNKVSLGLLHEFIFKKISKYEGERAVIKSLRVNAKFFDPINGDLLLGSELAIKLKPINEATKYLSLPESWFTYTYFSKVIIAFYEKNKRHIENLLPEIENALITHSLETKGAAISKKLLSKIIIQCNDATFQHLQDKVKDLAVKLIGDPAIGASWSIDPSIPESEKIEQRQAREILNVWITRQFISVFFEKCIKDPRRKKFWLQMAKHISDFKVCGPINIRRDLNNIQSISKLVDSRFNVTTGSKQVSAILMQIGDYKLIEFSDQGKAFYAYKRSNENAPSFQKKYYSVDSFVDSSMPMLVKISGSMIRENADEGRLFHKDGDLSWENVFFRWIKNKLEINV